MCVERPVSSDDVKEPDPGYSGRMAVPIFVIAALTITAAAVFTLAASLTTDRRIIWLTTWVFLLGIMHVLRELSAP